MLNQKWFKVALVLIIGVVVFLVLSQVFTGVFSDLVAKIIGAAVAVLGLFFGRFRKKSGN